MPRFAANLTMMYTEHPFLDRFGAAARDGFKGVELLFPYEFSAAELKARLDHRETYLKNLAYAAQAAQADGITVVIEPINTRDMPGYFLDRQDDAQAICAEVGAANLQVQFDCYHCQIVEGDLAVKLRRDMARIGHIQIAGVPERHEPDIGEINYPYLFELIDSLGYEGWIGCEYRPRASTSAGLGWLKAWLPRT
ncbi:hydroxypyruvate isomerase family protein [Paraburkholderia sp. GAS334]|uniref:hydroxypyruvate isomerase family protein n=1 Tax=Paraburkholderia sp. GAS334 TaxID=3035131 RepID=UPI003D1E54A3